MVSLLPPAWSGEIPPDETGRYALIEMGLLSPASRAALIDNVAPAYWPLIRDTSQAHLVREGPWLLQPDLANLHAWQAVEALPCALHAWIESPLKGAALAEQLAPAMIAESADHRPWLLRFYTSEAIQALHAETQADWHTELFSGITHWWYRNGDHEWQALAGLPPSVQPQRGWRLRLDNATWKALAGDPEVMTLTAQFVNDMPAVFAGLCAGERPRRVASALTAADDLQLSHPEDRRTYVYLWLTQGEAMLKQPPLPQAIARAARGESSLIEQLQMLKET